MRTRIDFPADGRNTELREAVRTLCSKYSLEYWDQHDRDEEFPEEFYSDFIAAGHNSILLPESYGGGGGSMSQMATALEEVAAGGGGMNATASVHIPIISIPTLLDFGSEEQKARYLPAMATGDMFITFGVTEPDAGTETTRISTRASKVEGGYLISGTKVWNTGALRGDKVLTLARTAVPDESGRRGDGLTLFLADLRGDTVSVKPIPKIGRNAVASCEVFFDEHFVPEEDLVGVEGQGFYHLLHSLNGERLLLAAEMIGIGRFAIESAAAYARERVVFSHPIGEFQSVQHPLAAAYLQLVAASELLDRLTTTFDTGDRREIGSMATGLKYLASEAAFAATDAAMQVYGGYSFAREYHIGRHWIESRLGRVAPINNQVVLNMIAESTLKLPRSY